MKKSETRTRNGANIVRIFRRRITDPYNVSRLAPPDGANDGPPMTADTDALQRLLDHAAVARPDTESAAVRWSR